MDDSGDAEARGAPEAPTTRRLTFLFADVEGSTRLVERHGQAAGAALSRYHELTAELAGRHGGRIFERIGDAAYACFSDAAAAVHAAVALQTTLNAADWGEVGRLRVRISLVSGEVEERGDRYYGRPLYRAARLQGLASGGETLLFWRHGGGDRRPDPARELAARPRAAAPARRGRARARLRVGAYFARDAGGGGPIRRAAPRGYEADD